MNNIRPFDFNSLSDEEKEYIDNARRRYKLYELRKRLNEIKPNMTPYSMDRQNEIEKQEDKLVVMILESLGLGTDEWDFIYETPSWEKIEEKESSLAFVEQYVKELKEAIVGIRNRLAERIAKKDTKRDGKDEFKEEEPQHEGVYRSKDNHGKTYEARELL